MASNATIQRRERAREPEREAHPQTSEGSEATNPLMGLFDATVHYAPSPALPTTSISAPGPQLKTASFHVVRTDEGEQIRMQRAGVDEDVWSDPEKMSVFLGKAVEGKSLSESEADALREFMQHVESEAVTDGTAIYTLLNDQLTHCHPHRVRALNEGPQALADAIASDLMQVYDAVFIEEKVRNKQAQVFRSRFDKILGIGSDCMEAFDVSLSRHEVARKFLNDLVRPSGRALLLLNATVEIDTAALYEVGLKEFEDEQQRLYRSYRRGQDETPREPPRFLLAEACRWLVGNYGGEAGKQARYQQVAEALVNQLGLRRSKFELKHGKTEIDVYFRCNSFGGHDPDYDTQRRFATIAKLFAEVYREAGDDPPAALTFYNPSSLAQSTTIDLGPCVRFRTYVSKAKVILTEAFAQKLREFVASYAPVRD